MKAILRHKEDGTIGTLEYSMFGGSVHFITENGALGKTMGDRIDVILSQWDIIELPDGYEVGEYGGVKKKS